MRDAEIRLRAERKILDELRKKYEEAMRQEGAIVSTKDRGCTDGCSVM